MNRKAVSLFSGAGGMDLGIKYAEFDIVFANDIDEDSRKTYRHNIGNHICGTDVTEIDVKDIPDCDLIFGGPPCQGFSIAGKMDPDDPRSQMIWEFQRIVLGKMPKVFIMENVAALSRLKKFTDIKNKLLKTYRDAGYHVECMVVNAADHLVPQKRERTIIIGNLERKPLYPDKSQRNMTVRESLSDMDRPGKGANDGVCTAKITFAKKPVLRKSPFAGMMFNGAGRPIDLNVKC